MNAPVLRLDHEIQHVLWWSGEAYQLVSLADAVRALDELRAFVLWLTPCGQPDAGQPPEYKTIGEEARKMWAATCPPSTALAVPEKEPQP